MEFYVKLVRDSGITFLAGKCQLVNSKTCVLEYSTLAKLSSGNVSRFQVGITSQSHREEKGRTTLDSINRLVDQLVYQE